MTRVCPRCATLLDQNAHGLCARCLYQLALTDPEPPQDAPFRLVTLLGTGPHGTTYLAEQDDEPRYVSLKVLREPDTRAARARLAAVRSALLASRHPSLVSPVAIILEPELAVAAAFVQGKRASAAGSDRLAGCADIAEAIAYLHRRGIIHANLHASNVLAVPADAPSGRSRWCLIDLASAAPLASAADAAIDVAAFGRLMIDVLGAAGDQTAIRRVINRACGAGTGSGYASAADLVHDLRELAMLSS